MNYSLFAKKEKRVIVKKEEYYFINNASGLVYKIQDNNLTTQP